MDGIEDFHGDGIEDGPGPGIEDGGEGEGEVAENCGRVKTSGETGGGGGGELERWVRCESSSEGGFPSTE